MGQSRIKALLCEYEPEIGVAGLYYMSREGLAEKERLSARSNGVFKIREPEPLDRTITFTAKDDAARRLAEREIDAFFKGVIAKHYPAENPVEATRKSRIGEHGRNLGAQNEELLKALAPTFEALQKDGLNQSQIAAKLNEMGHTTVTGKMWTQPNVLNAMKRLRLWRMISDA